MSGIRPIFVFYLLAFAWSWGIWWPAVQYENGAWTAPSWVPSVFASGGMAAWGPLFAAIIVSFVFGGRKGLAALARSMLKARVGWVWWLIAILMIPATIGLAWVIAKAMGADIPPSEAFANPVSIPVAFIWILFMGGPLQEEAGWRGIATKELQQRFSPFIVALGVGALWGLWHLPLFHLPSAGIYYEQPFWGLFLSTVFLSFMIGWVYNKTGGSLLLAMVIHASFNWANYLFPVLATDLGGQLYFAGMILIAAVILWKDGLNLGAHSA